MKVINCTPHPIKVRRNDGSEIVFEPSGILPRVSTIETLAGEIKGIPCVTQTQGEISGLPEPETGTVFMVSALVFNASDRRDLIAPDTGKGAIRDEKGRIQAVTRLLVKEEVFEI